MTSIHLVAIATLASIGCQVSAQLSAGSPNEPEPAAPVSTPAPPASVPADPPAGSVPPAPPQTPAPATTEPASTLPPSTSPLPEPTTAPPTATAPAPLPPERTVRTSGDRILLPGNVVFATGQAVLQPTPENETVLQQLKVFIDENPKVSHVRIEGYTDNVGQPEANLRLSGERALAIKNWLVARGIESERLIAVGFGDQNPIADNTTPAGRAQNRRTEFKIAAVNGNPYRGVPLNGGGTEFR